MASFMAIFAVAAAIPAGETIDRTLSSMPDSDIQPPAPPAIVVRNLREQEKPVKVEFTETVEAENAFFVRKKALFTFTNPNTRQMEGDFEFPVPEGAYVCAYSLEIDGAMIPGVVCPKEKARVAFENETRKNVDPGIVEQVKGNIWKTRIFPLVPGTPRKAEVSYVAPKDFDAKAEPVYEKDGDDIFRAVPAGDALPSVSSSAIAAFSRGAILWDVSLSRKGRIAADREKLAAHLPDSGEWTLVVFAERPYSIAAFTGKTALLAAIDSVVYDGATDISAAIAAAGADTPKLLFSDESETLSAVSCDFERDATVIIASRPDCVRRPVEVVRLSDTEKAGLQVNPLHSTLLATVWAARRMEDLAFQADSRKDEFLALGRRYGVAGPGLSLIVLENLSQYLEYKIEPPDTLSFHDEWVRQTKASDGEIDLLAEKVKHASDLLRYWNERVKWWNDPKPPVQTPKSGLFDNAVSSAASVGGARTARRSVEMMADSGMAAPDEEDRVGLSYEVDSVESIGAQGLRSNASVSKSKSPGALPLSSRAASASVVLKPWNPKMPYIEALKAAPKDEAYAAYLREREKYESSPAFYLDCAGWFFGEGLTDKAERIISNLAEFRLEDPALWRTMGWRLRQAGSYDFAVTVFRHVLEMRGEEPQSCRDLATVLCERGKRGMSKLDIEEALELYCKAAFNVHGRKSGRSGNDMQTSVFALEDLNGLLAWCNAHEWKDGAPAAPEMEEAFRRDLPVDMRIVMTWDADQTDIDIHVMEPNGEEAFYRNRRTAEGGFVSEDVTTGYGPEEYMAKTAQTGVYKVLSNYFASRQTALTGAVTVQVTVYTGWGTADEKMQILTMRLDKPKDKYLIGEVKFER